MWGRGGGGGRGGRGAEGGGALRRTTLQIHFQFVWVRTPQINTHITRALIHSGILSARNRTGRDLLTYLPEGQLPKSCFTTAFLPPRTSAIAGYATGHPKLSTTVQVLLYDILLSSNLCHNWLRHRSPKLSTTVQFLLYDILPFSNHSHS